MIRAAYYYSTPTGAELVLQTIDNGRRRIVSEHFVGSKREARKIAVAQGFTPYNF